MPSLFTRIIQGDIPGRFVYRDELCVAFLTIAPIRQGHTLVVPIAEVDHWIDLPGHLTAHLFQVATKVGQALQRAFQPTKVGMMIAGLEVPHTHLHLVPIHAIGDLDFSQQNPNPDPASLDEAMERIIAELAK